MTATFTFLPGAGGGSHNRQASEKGVSFLKTILDGVNLNVRLSCFGYPETEINILNSIGDYNARVRAGENNLCRPYVAEYFHTHISQGLGENLAFDGEKFSGEPYPIQDICRFLRQRGNFVAYSFGSVILQELNNITYQALHDMELCDQDISLCLSQVFCLSYAPVAQLGFHNRPAFTTLHLLNDQDTRVLMDTAYNDNEQHKSNHSFGAGSASEDIAVCFINASEIMLYARGLDGDKSFFDGSRPYATPSPNDIYGLHGFNYYASCGTGHCGIVFPASGHHLLCAVSENAIANSEGLFLPLPPIKSLADEGLSVARNKELQYSNYSVFPYYTL